MMTARTARRSFIKAGVRFQGLGISEDQGPMNSDQWSVIGCRFLPKAIL